MRACRVPGAATPLGGSLYHPTCREACQLWEATILCPEDEALLRLQRALLAALGDEGVAAAAATAAATAAPASASVGAASPGLRAVSGAQLRELAERLSMDRVRAYRHAPLIELSAAILHAMPMLHAIPQPSSADARVSGSNPGDGAGVGISNAAVLAELEKMVLVMVRQSPRAEGVLQTLVELIQASEKQHEGDQCQEGSGSTPLRVIILTLIFAYSVCVAAC
eukprot:COSAG01_NODE_3193_length_6435_cov_5.956597_2_plen_224_part_00